MSDREKRLIDANELKDSFGFLRKMWSATEICGIIDAMPTADVTVQKWIPVSERLPEPNEDGSVNAVLVTNGFVIHMAYFNNKNWWFCESGQAAESMFYVVTHWMPLPEPPKECE